MRSNSFFALTFLLLLVLSCKKEETTSPEPPAGFKLSYSDTTFYLKQSAYVAQPTTALEGKYEAHPDNLNINNTTGAITVSLNGKDGESQTGLRYKITYTSPKGDKYSTHIVLAGIHYQDKIVFENNNPYIDPIFNANPSLANPGGTFSSEDDDDLVINPTTGRIDLKQSIANGIMGGNPESDDWKVVNVEYSTTYEGQPVKHNINLLIYLYESIDVIPKNVSAVMSAHQGLLNGIPAVNIPQTFHPEDKSINDEVFADKPRPPCIILIAN
jgi:hypothetical protein